MLQSKTIYKSIFSLRLTEKIRNYIQPCREKPIFLFKERVYNITFAKHNLFVDHQTTLIVKTKYKMILIYLSVTTAVSEIRSQSVPQLCNDSALRAIYEDEDTETKYTNQLESPFTKKTMEPCKEHSESKH